MTGRLFVVGSINTDLVVRAPRFPSPGETLVGESFATYGGGKGANQAIAAARAGAMVEFVGAVGSDAYSLERLAAFDADRVGRTHVRRFAGPGGIALIQVDAGGRDAITIVPGANGQLEPSDVEGSLADKLVTADLLCCQLELPLRSVERALQHAHQRQVPTLLNAAPYVEGTRALLTQVEILVVNEIEAGQLLGSLEPVGVAAAVDAARTLAGLGPNTVVITLGAAGAALAGPDVEALVAAPSVAVADTTGAGDAFVGAFCTWSLRQAPCLEAVQAGVVAGGLGAVATVLGAAACLHGKQGGQLHRIGIEMPAVHGLGLKHQVIERQREQRLHLGQAPGLPRRGKVVHQWASLMTSMSCQSSLPAFQMS
mgnify:CR=1 FL=1